MAQAVKNLPANAGDTRDDTRAQSLVWEDPLEKGMATHSSILLSWGGGFRGQRSLMGYNPEGHKESEKTEKLTLSLFQPLQLLG